MDAFLRLQQNQPELQLPIPGSIFSAISLNLGHQVVAELHKDFKNLAYGLCHICALGNFDAELSGHLILWELDLLIEFPPGSSILITSALISHGNTELQVGEERYSVIQYTAGGLFRWVEYGCRTEAQFGKEKPEEAARVWNERPERWKEAISLFSNVSEYPKCPK